MDSPNKNPPRRTRKRRHSPKQLSERPITIDSCAGQITVSAEKTRGCQVVITLPDGMTVSQPPPPHQ